MNPTLIYPAKIGKPAFQAIMQSADFTVMGNTSRGIFLSIADQRMIFLSREMYRGPLSINIPGMHSVLDEIPLRETGEVEKGVIRFASSPIEIECSQLEPWSALSDWSPIDPRLHLGKHDRFGRQISNFLSMVTGDVENELIISVLSEIEGGEYPTRPDTGNETGMQLHLMAEGLRSHNIASIVEAAYFFAGRGRGLTPSGDDFLLGCVYAIFMLQRGLSPEFLPIVDTVVNIVKRRSTIISGSLIECAAFGEIDERLGKAFQAMLDEYSPSELIITGLRSWGSSSGMDTAAGMGLGLSCLLEFK